VGYSLTVRKLVLRDAPADPGLLDDLADVRELEIDDD
jgi:hypothetical protein